MAMPPALAAALAAKAGKKPTDPKMKAAAMAAGRRMMGGKGKPAKNDNDADDK